jgi:murein L,D-transpeptidase YcbB/YkuD
MPNRGKMDAMTEETQIPAAAIEAPVEDTTENMEQPSEALAAAIVDPAPVVEDAPPVIETPKPSGKKFKEPVAIDIEAVREALPQPAGDAVVGNGVVDDVLVKAMIYKNIHARKSLSIHHLQRRLVELGYAAAGSDKDGYYGDATVGAVAAFQAKEGIEGNGIADGATLEAIFKGDPNVRVVL